MSSAHIAHAPGMGHALLPEWSDPDTLPPPARLGEWMARRQAGVEPLPLLADSLIPVTGLPAGAPLARANIGAAHTVSDWGGRPYHCAAHHGDVGLSAMMLCEISSLLGQPLSPLEKVILLYGAFVHDIHHAPGRDALFAQERVAAEAGDAIARRAGVDAATRYIIRLLVLSTDPRMRPLIRVLASGQDTEMPEEIGAMRYQPGLVRLASILSDADLMPSAGLTEAWNTEMTARYVAETGLPGDLAARRGFFEHVVGPSFISFPGIYLNPNLERIRAAACEPDFSSRRPSGPA